MKKKKMMMNLWKKPVKLRPNRFGQNYRSALLILSCVFVFACQPPVDKESEPAFSSKGADITPTPKQNLTKFESQLKSMRIADFYHIYSIKRKDGATFESEDKAFVRENIHYATNRTSFIKDDTILFIGTNYKPSYEQLEALKERFELMDFSKPDEQIEREKAEKKAERDKLKEEMEAANPSSTDQNENTNVQ